MLTGLLEVLCGSLQNLFTLSQSLLSSCQFWISLVLSWSRSASYYLSVCLIHQLSLQKLCLFPFIYWYVDILQMTIVYFAVILEMRWMMMCYRKLLQDFLPSIWRGYDLRKLIESLSFWGAWFNWVLSVLHILSGIHEHLHDLFRCQFEVHGTLTRISWR